MAAVPENMIKLICFEVAKGLYFTFLAVQISGVGQHLLVVGPHGCATSFDATFTNRTCLTKLR